MQLPSNRSIVSPSEKGSPTLGLNTLLWERDMSIDARQGIEAAPEAEAERIARAPEPEVRDYMHRGMTGRWLSTVVRCLNGMERQAGTRALAEHALRKLGIPTAQ